MKKPCQKRLKQVSFVSTPEVCNGKTPTQSKIRWIKPREVRVRRVEKKSPKKETGKEKFLPLKLLVPDEKSPKLRVLLHHYDEKLCSYEARARAVDEDNNAHLNKKKVVRGGGGGEGKGGVMGKVMRRVQGTGTKIYSMFCLDCQRVEEHATMMIHRQGFSLIIKILHRYKK